MSTVAVLSHSAVVELALRIGDRNFPLGQVGDSHVVLSQKSPVPPGRGAVIAIIDGVQFVTDVELPDGADGASRRIGIMRLGDAVEVSL